MSGPIDGMSRIRSFKKSLRFELEHGPDNDVPADYATLAIWYQDHPHPAFPPLPDSLGPMEALPPFAIAGLVEAEGLVGVPTPERTGANPVDG